MQPYVEPKNTAGKIVWGVIFGILILSGLFFVSVIDAADVTVDGVDSDASAAKEAYEAEHHVHSPERWLGASASPSGEVTIADDDSTTTFQVDGGNNTWGSWVQVLGSGDTPVISGMNYYDLHRLIATAFERTTAVHIIQVGFGASGAAALSAGTYTEMILKPTSAASQQTPAEIQMSREPITTKAWVRVWVLGQNTGTVDFYIGLHEYAR